MRTNTGFMACLFLLFFCSPALAGQASSQSVRHIGELPGSAGTCADCGLREGSLNHTWMHGGGARLYWNTLTRPRQILTSGARFTDPASLPELQVAPVPNKSKPRTGRSRPRASRVAAPVANAAPTSPAPKGVGSTALQVSGAPKAPQTPAPAGGAPAPKADTPATPAPEMPATPSRPAEPAQDKAKESGEQPRLRDILLPTGGASLPGAEAGRL